jgi:cytochrome P450
MKAQIPGRTGDAWAARNVADSQADLLGFLRDLAHEHGDVAAFDLGRARCVLISGALQARQLLTEHEHRLLKPEFLKASNRGHWGDGLTTLEGADWAQHRQMLQPSFTARAVARRMAVVQACTNEMLDRWSPTGRVDLAHELRVLTARIALRTVLGADLQGWAPDGVPFNEAYGEDFAGTGSGDPDAPWVMTRPLAPRRMDTVLALVDARLAGAPAREDVLSDLVHARTPQGASLSRDEIVGEVIQMLYAGHLTIPSSLIHFWRDLSRSGLTATLVQEARTLPGGSTAHLQTLAGTYGLAALKESLRLHAPAPVLYREVDEAFDLSGHHFSRGLAVWMSPALLQSDARYYDQPHQFRPERFMPGRAERASMVAFFPFGAGPRTCIGSHQSLQQMTLMALVVARRYTLLEESAATSGFHAIAHQRDGSE